MNFRRSVIIAELWRHEIARPGNFVSNFWHFFKTIPLKLSLLRWSRPESARASPTFGSHCSRFHHFRRSYCRTRVDRFCPVEYFQYRLFEPIIVIPIKYNNNDHITTVIQVNVQTVTDGISRRVTSGRETTSLILVFHGAKVIEPCYRNVMLL